MGTNLPRRSIAVTGICLALFSAVGQVSRPEDLPLGKRIKGLAGLEEYALTASIKDAAAETLRKQKDALYKELLSNPGLNIFYEVQIYQFRDTAGRWSAGPIRVGKGRNAVEALIAHWNTTSMSKNPQPTEPDSSKPDLQYQLMPGESYFIGVSLKGNTVKMNPINWGDCMNTAIKAKQGR